MARLFDFICGLVVSMCFSEKKFIYHYKNDKNKLIEYKKLFCGAKTFPGRMKTFATEKESLDLTLSLK